MPRFVVDAGDPEATGVVVPGIYASLLGWAQDEYACSGDPRRRFHHDDDAGEVCQGPAPTCGHEEPKPNPHSPAARRLEVIKAGEPVVVSAWIARGHRWRGQSWSGPEFELPWGGAVRNVRISADDRVIPA